MVRRKVESGNTANGDWLLGGSVIGILESHFYFYGFPPEEAFRATLCVYREQGDPGSLV